ncbi:MAG: LegC family aminotransferase [Coriobacteriia bacterium]|nr:LegC family aminotransferase [Coriobacteriia bacterium]
MSDPFLPLSAPVITGNERAYVEDCLDTGWVSTSGGHVRRFEQALCELTGSPFAVACNSGTSALHVSLISSGIGHGDAVIAPAVTFIASCNAIAYTGARPVFVDCDDFLCMDPESVESYLTDGCESSPLGPVDRLTGLRVRALMPVHVFGNPCDMVALMRIAKNHGLAVIEDAAESVGSRWTAGPLAGRHTGTVGTIGAMSFNGNKIVTCGGGGAILTSDEAVATRARHLTTQAKTDAVRFVHDAVGYNYRLTNVAAAIGVGQLENLHTFIATKKRNLNTYAEEFSDTPGLEMLGTPDGTAPNHWFYTLLIDAKEAGADRDAIMAHLLENGIESRPLWELNNRQSPYREDRAWATERSAAIHSRALNLPCSSDLTEAGVRRVCDAVRQACRKGLG